MVAKYRRRPESPAWARPALIQGRLGRKNSQSDKQTALPLLNSQVEAEFSPYFKKAIIRDLFRGEKTLGKTLGCGVGMPVSRAIEAMKIAFRLYKDANVVLPLILSHRFVKGTRALLGFTRFDTTAVLEMDAVITPRPAHTTTKSGKPLMRPVFPSPCTGGNIMHFLPPIACEIAMGTLLSTIGSPVARRCSKTRRCGRYSTRTSLLA